MLKKITLHARILLMLLFYVLISSFFLDCKPNNEKKVDENELNKGTFAYDLDFLKKNYADLVVLKDGDAKVIISPALQGRVMTSTANGDKGQSFGWLNYDLIASGEQMEHINPTGGEERFWLGPEGGQFSIYFKPETTFDFENWYVPSELDTEPFELVSNNTLEATFEKNMRLVNYSKTIFDIKVDRTIRLIDKTQGADALGIDVPEAVAMVGFESKNTLTNTGNNTWNKESGMLSIWILSMLNSSEGITVIIPFKTGEASELGKIVNDDYFGKVPNDRLRILDSVLLFNGDGKQRGKIGVSPLRAKPLMGSYDSKNKVLSVALFTLPHGNTDYVNSQWAHQESPFEGDVVNSYNDGPLEDGTQLGPFYELESSSPAASLKSNEKIVHRHQTYHFEGNEVVLNTIATQLFGVSLLDLK